MKTKRKPKLEAVEIVINNAPCRWIVREHVWGAPALVDFGSSEQAQTAAQLYAAAREINEALFQMRFAVELDDRTVSAILWLRAAIAFAEKPKATRPTFTSGLLEAAQRALDNAMDQIEAVDEAYPDMDDCPIWATSVRENAVRIRDDARAAIAKALEVR